MESSVVEQAIKRRWPAFDDTLASGVRARLATIAQRWPDASADTSAYADYVVERLARQPDPLAALARMYFDDLFLAWWAGTGSDRGIQAFEAEFAGEQQRIAARFSNLPSEDVEQQLRVRLFVGDRPKIHEYSGVGSLLGWVRVVTMRSFVDVARANRRTQYLEDLDDSELLGVQLITGVEASSFGPDLVPIIKGAFADAVSGLAPKQRAFLRHAYVDRLTLDQIAQSYSIHRATVARVLKSAREQLIEHTRTNVIAAVGVAPAELGSALSTIEQRLELSLSRLLKSA